MANLTRKDIKLMAASKEARIIQTDLGIDKGVRRTDKDGLTRATVERDTATIKRPDLFNRPWFYKGERPWGSLSRKEKKAILRENKAERKGYGKLEDRHRDQDDPRRPKLG